MKIRHFLLCVVVLMSSWAVGCAPARSGMDYLASGGRGEIVGEMNGMEICAVVDLGPNGESVRVEYLSPNSLCGLVFSAEGEQCEVRLGEMSFVCGLTEVAGFLRPATVFLPQGDANSVQKEGENTCLTFSEGEVLTLSPKGEPLSFAREDLHLRVTWWQSGYLSTVS